MRIRFEETKGGSEEVHHCGVFAGGESELREHGNKKMEKRTRGARSATHERTRGIYSTECLNGNSILLPEN